MSGRLERAAFTLIELMVVMGILAIILSFALPAFNSVGRAAGLQSGANVISDTLKLARQTALAQNRKIMVRFYDVSGVGSSHAFNTLRLYGYDDSGKIPVPMGPFIKLPQGIVVDSTPDFSTILSADNLDLPSAREDLPAQKNVPFKTLEFGPTGGTNLPLATSKGDKWFVSIKNENEPAFSGTPGRNFVTVVVDSVTGRLKTFQP